MSRKWSNVKPDEVYAQTDDGRRRKVGITRFEPNERWYKEHDIDIKKIGKVEWVVARKAWIIKLKS